MREMTRGEKGSQHRMRAWVNDAPEDLNAHLLGWSSLAHFQDGEPRWLSPIEPDYTEIRDSLWQKAQLPGKSPQRERWWPHRGPQWDAVAALRGPRHEPGVLLVEAKSHPAEVLSTASAKYHESEAMIMRALAETKRYLGVDERQDSTSPYYQMANRLAFLYFLRVRQEIPAWLVFLYFVDDQFLKSKSLDRRAEKP